MPNIDTESLSENVITGLSESFKALADPTRLRILALLFTGEKSVGYLSNHLKVSQSAISHQLRILRSMDIVRFRKDGREVYYTLADEHVRDIFYRALEHITHN